MLRKTYPFNSESSFFNSFKIIFISEGYLASESASFTASCIDFVDRLLNTFPFNLTRINNNWLSFYSSFIASNNQGTGIDSSSVTDRTAFGALALADKWQESGICALCNLIGLADELEQQEEDEFPVPQSRNKKII